MNHHRTHRNRAARFALLAGIILGGILVERHEPTVAFANDDKVFAPQLCMPQREPGMNEITGKTGDMLFNPMTIMNTEVPDGYQTFVCPLVRDIVTGHLDQVWVRLVNNHPEAPFPPKCCVYSVALDSEAHDFECRTANNAIHGPLSLPFELDGVEDFDHGHYAVLCELGVADQIISIRTSESD